MRKFYYLLFATALLVSCNTLKRAEQSLNQGDYTEAFDVLLRKYQKGISSNKHEKFLPTFQEAYLKMVDAEEEKIERLTLEGNPVFYCDVYNGLVGLDDRQRKLKALLPLYYKGKKLKFPTKNYAPAIVKAKAKYLDYLYTSSSAAIHLKDKREIRKAYTNLKKVNDLSPNYRDVRDLMDEAHFRGTDFILVDVENKSNQIIPRRLEEDLTKMNTYGLDDFWTTFHTENQANIPYEYLIQLNFQRILVSPERVNTVRNRFQKEIVDGWEYLYQNGQQVVDSLGQPIKVDKYITVRAELEETFQEKDAMIEGRVNFIHLPTNRNLDSDRLFSEFTFRNHYGRIWGDQRALDDEYRRIIGNRPIPFPTHEQMVYDCGEELKNQLKSFLRRKF